MLAGTPEGQRLSSEQIGLAVGMASLSGALVAGLVGQNPNAAATSAANEAQNNQFMHPSQWVPPPPSQLAGTDASGPKGTWTPNQQGQFDENTLEGKPNNAGKDTNLGTSSPLVEQATRLLDGFPQWFTDASNGVLANPRACFVSPIACGANILASAIKDGGGRAINSTVGFDTSNLESKLNGYLLDAAHPQNQTKANWFS